MADDIGKGSWQLRAGAASVQPNDSSGEVTGIPGSGASVDSNTQLGLTASYFLGEKWALGILAATPFTHDVSGSGSIAGLGKIASLKHLPPTFTLQYHFGSGSSIRPYVGAGLNYTLFFDESATASLEGALGGPVDVELDDSFGLAAELGMNISLQNDWQINIVAWYIDIATTAKLTAGATQLSVDVDVDPLVWMIGLGKSF